MNDKELALINQRAVDLVDPENRCEAGVDLLTNDVFRLLNENDRLRKALEEAKETTEGLYQIIQRGDLTLSDMDEAEIAYDRFLEVLRVEPAKGEDTQ